MSAEALSHGTGSSYLTKSRFQIGIECPTKLYYHLNSHRYPNTKLDDPFLEALAKGGFQVGALARAYYPDGILISEESNHAAAEKTVLFLQQEKCTLFEAAIQVGDFFIRVDILNKNGDHVELIEVKAKSYHPDQDSFITAKGLIQTKWEKYILDVAFQQMVLKKAFPHFTVNCFLMLADKSKIATVDGLNQKFRIVSENSRFKVVTSPNLTAADLGEKILGKVPVDNEIDILRESQFEIGGESYDFVSLANLLASDLKTNNKRYVGIGKHCHKCEFEADGVELSGFKECWKHQAGLTDSQLQQPLLFELWRGNLGSKDILTPLFNRRDYFLRDFREDDYAPKKIKICEGFSAAERRTMQIHKTSNKDYLPAYEEEFLKKSFESFTYPLHFIDFETTALAIPMYAGIRPYEQIAFQFSHHKVDKDGRISHETQWLNDTVGVFPNFEFVRALKKALENDQGAIFRYHNHENTILNVIHEQLMNSNEPDKKELCDFICSITHETNVRTGERDMVDLYKLVIGGFYHTAMKGSNSIKAVLPAIIECSEFLQNKYSKPCYGTGDFPSLNLKNHTWLLKGNSEKWLNPYKSLPPVFEGIDSDSLDNFCIEEDEGLRDGGAAMMAYAKMQFAEMSEAERAFYRQALLRYCELDTLAMVMIYEGWKDFLYDS